MGAAQRIGDRAARCRLDPTGSNARITHSLGLDLAEGIASGLCEPAPLEREENLAQLSRCGDDRHELVHRCLTLLLLSGGGAARSSSRSEPGLPDNGGEAEKVEALNILVLLDVLSNRLSTLL